METSIIYCGDCLKQLEKIPSESIDLIYIDPPFSSNRNYVAFWQEQEARHFEDRFENVQAYLEYMFPRVKELYRALKQNGSFYYHCDWHATHYIKRMLDRDDLFGYPNFRNEIIWAYRTGGVSKRWFARKHETLLFYTKSKDYTFNVQHYKSWQKKKYNYSEKYPEYYDNEERRWYHLAVCRDIWDDIDAIGTEPDKPERLRYPTQKPQKLLERIIEASSNEGDIVLDAFCGCGTTLIEAQKLKRKWIGIDISPTACRVMVDRLESKFTIREGRDFWVRDLPKTIEELREYPPFEFQNWAVYALGGVPSRVKVRNGGVDGKVYPVEHIKKEKEEGTDMFGDIDRYIPVQVKRTDQVGSPDIRAFETAMKRDKRDKGIFVGFDFSRDALHEIRRAERNEGLEIEPITVAQIVEQQLDKRLK